MKTRFRCPVALAALFALSLPFGASAKVGVRSHSQDLIIVQPQDLPEQARLPGSSMFLYADNRGATYLCIEQQMGARLSILDVTDPAHIRVTGSSALPSLGEFDPVRPLSERAMIVRFHDGNGMGVLTLPRSGAPTLTRLDRVTELGQADSISSASYVSAVSMYPKLESQAHDYQVLDLSAPATPIIVTVKGVRQKAVNPETGTTFLLGNDGLTVIRCLTAENDHRVRMWQGQGN